MNLQTWDLGEIIRNHVYIREIYPTNLKDKCLFSSKDFLQKLAKINEYLGINWKSHEITIKIKLPYSSYPEYRDHWNLTSLRKSDERNSITHVDRYSRNYDKEVVFASSEWMGEYDAFPGDEIIISPIPLIRKL